MNKILLLPVALGMIFFLATCEKKEREKVPDAGRLVKTILLSAMDQGINRSYPGRVSASQKVDLAFEVVGRLIELPIYEGKKVQKGQLLAKLDARNYQHNLAQEKAKYQQTQASHERYRLLLQSANVSQAEYDEKLASFLIAKANVAIAAKALEDATLTAPFTGLIAKKYVDNFQFVQSKQPIVSVQDVSDLEIIINVPERDISQAREIERFKIKATGKEAIGNVRFTTMPGREFPVSVKAFKAEADPRTQTYEVTLLMPSPERAIILPGMTADVTLRFVSPDSHTFRIPVHAVSTDIQGNHYVWSVDMTAMTVKKQLITVGEMSGDNILVLSGLKVGERIVVAGVAYLRAGMKVRLLTGKIGK